MRARIIYDSIVKTWTNLANLKKEKVAISDNFSHIVAPPGIEPESKV